MKVKSVRAVLEDYNTQCQTYRQHYDNYSEIQRLFNPNSPMSYSIGDEHLANNIGEICLDKLTEAIVSIIFSEKDSIIKVKAAVDPTKAVAIEKALTEYIENSNFMIEFSKMVRCGLMWQNGFINLGYASGLYFSQFDGYDMIVTKSHTSNKRTYVVAKIPVRDLMLEFTNIPGDLMEDPNKEVDVLQCVLPINEEWIEKSDVHKFVSVSILPEYELQLEPKKSTGRKFHAFPIINFTPYAGRSICNKAHRAAGLANYYEKLDASSLEWNKFPAFNVDAQNVLEGSANLYPFGQIPIEPGGTPAAPVQNVTNGDEIVLRKIAINEQKVRDIFMIPQLEALVNVSLTQYEYHDKQAKVLSLLLPLIGNLPAVLTDVLMRTHALLYSHDKSYRETAGALDIEFEAVGIQRLINKYKKMASIGRAAQAATPYIQAGKDVLSKADPDRLYDCIVKSLDLEEITMTAEEQQAQAQAQAQEEQRLRQIEQAELAAKTNPEQGEV